MHDDYRGVGNQSPLPLIDLEAATSKAEQGWESVTSPFDRLISAGRLDQVFVGNQSPLPLIDLAGGRYGCQAGWESVTSPFDRLTVSGPPRSQKLGISHLSL